MNAVPYSELTDLQLYSLGAWREADDQGQSGMRGVAHSIDNRAKSTLRWWGGPDLRSILLFSYKGVYQYDCFDPNDVDSRRWPADDDPQWLEAQSICQAIIAGTDADNTGGATTYYSDDISAPWWARDMTKTTKILNLIFFR